MASLAFDSLERMYGNEMSLADIMEPIAACYEIGRRSITLNGNVISEHFMSDGTSKVKINGLPVVLTYVQCFAWAKGELK